MDSNEIKGYSQYLAGFYAGYLKKQAQEEDVGALLDLPGAPRIPAYERLRALRPDYNEALIGRVKRWPGAWDEVLPPSMPGYQLLPSREFSIIGLGYGQFR